MRFAWQRKNSTDKVSAEQSSTGRFIYIAYNIVYWFPIVLTVTKVIDYRTGFITFSLILITRAVANLYRNNFLTLEKAEIYPFRIP